MVFIDYQNNHYSGGTWIVLVLRPRLNKHKQDMYEEKFIIKIYGFGELASLYNTKVQPASARVMLRRWIHHNPKFKDELYAVGYKKVTRLLLLIQVQVIVQFLGVL